MHTIWRPECLLVTEDHDNSPVLRAWNFAFPQHMFWLRNLKEIFSLAHYLEAWMLTCHWRSWQFTCFACLKFWVPTTYVLVEKFKRNIFTCTLSGGLNAYLSLKIMTIHLFCVLEILSTHNICFSWENKKKYFHLRTLIWRPTCHFEAYDNFITTCYITARQPIRGVIIPSQLLLCVKPTAALE